MTTEQHLLWYYFNTQDIFFSIDKWPLWAQKQMLKPHKSHKDYYELFGFLVYNGLHPEIADDWISAKSTTMDRSRLIYEQYDASYHRSAMENMERARNGTLFGHGRRIFDMIQGRVVST